MENTALKEDNSLYIQVTENFIFWWVKLSRWTVGAEHCEDPLPRHQGTRLPPANIRPQRGSHPSGIYTHDMFIVVEIPER